MFLKRKDLFEKVNFETSLAADNNKSMNNYPACKDLILALIVIPIYLGTHCHWIYVTLGGRL